MKKSRILLFIMPRLCTLITVIFFTLSACAQETATANNNEIKKYSYQFIGEITYPQTGVSFHVSNFHVDDSYWNQFRVGFHFINSMVYKEKIAIGLGIGWEYTFLIDMGFPIFADFRYYFTEKKLQPLLDIGVGTIITVYAPPLTILQDVLYVEKPGFYFNCTGGFKYKHFQFHAGLNIRTHESIDYDITHFYLSLNGIIKCGFNF